MTSSFLAVLASVSFVAGGASFFARRRLSIPLLGVLSLGLLAAFSAALLPWKASASTKWGAVLSLSLLCATWIARRSSQGPARFPRAAKLLLLVPIFILIGNFWIAERNGWHLTAQGTSPHFRFPFNDDVERNVVLVETLARGSRTSPYLANSRLNYQVYWHSLASFFLSGNLDEGPSVAGVARATGLIFFTFVAWLLFSLRPALASRPKLAVALLLLLFLHADLYNLVLSFFLYGRPGIEADWSVGRASIYRYVSFSFLELASPQHLFFFLFATASLAITHYRRRLRIRRDDRLGDVLAIFAFLASPLLSLVLFPPIALWQTIRERKFTPILRWALVTAVAALVFFLVFRHSVLDLLLREAVTTISRPPKMGWGWLLLPLVGVTSLGVLGLWAMLWCGVSARNRSAWKNPWLAYLVAGLLFFNYVVTSPEIKRHFGWIALLLFLFYFFDTAFRKNLRRLSGFAMAGGALVFSLHVYFLYSFLAKPSVVPPSIAWHDYFEMSRQLKSKFPEIPVVAAVNSDVGILMSPLVRATSTFSIPSHAMIHSTLSAEQRRLLALAQFDSTSVPYAKPLGYQAILWDDIAEQVWGEKVKQRFTDEKNLLLRAGKVSLYRLVDKLETPDRTKHAEALAREGWHFEAVNAYNALIREKPSALLHRRLSESLFQLGAKASAARHAHTAKTLENP